MDLIRITDEDLQAAAAIRSIVEQWEAGLISTSECMMKIVSTDTRDLNIVNGICDMIPTLRAKEEREAEQYDLEMQETISLMKHGPHGKRCYCDECREQDDQY